ncbi:hypothetical protein G7Y89_g11508 [Cudoniella acicularis]|uniref:AAA+ ATPase domain-containing protein n=1 Tax=Cudoniella acicularis TaxID=354080 RepID=A0A8H4RD38_9HELO|nr:hypothetical protein G7Y89_g11508 [Cudoniella acicularis]
MDESQIFSPEPEVDTHPEVFKAFKHRNFGLRTISELFLKQVLRDQYPTYQVTNTVRNGWDFVGFANAGNATAVQDTTEESFQASRTYVAPGLRDDGIRGYRGRSPPRDHHIHGYTIPGISDSNGRGTLENHVRFGRWRYTFKEVEYIIYEIDPTDGYRGAEKYIFVLAPRDAPADDKGVSATDQLLLAVGSWSTVLHDEIYVFDDGAWHKSRQLWQSCIASNWDDVILAPDTKSSLIADVNGFFSNRSLYKELGVPWKRGVIFHGVPGNGKTISIKALISTLSKRDPPIPSLYVKALSHYSDDIRSIRMIFTHARTIAPCLLIFEDLDSLVRDRCRSYFLNEVDGLESNEGILMIGSTNHLDTLDSAITKRPSRFDRKYHFKLPEEEERLAYCKFWCQKLESSTLVEFPKEMCTIIMRLTEGFSFAYMKELFIVSLLTIARGGTGDEVEEPAVLVSHSEAVEVTSSDSEADYEVGIPIREREKPKKRIVPDVEIPEELKGNLLLRVLKVHLRLLVEEMDSTGEDEDEVVYGPPRRGPPPPPPLSRRRR